LKDAGLNWAIIGQAERRLINQEGIINLGSKVKHAMEYDVNVIYCVGDNSIERDALKTNEVITGQLEQLKDWIYP
jgi:triosephosphate isomerase